MSARLSAIPALLALAACAPAQSPNPASTSGDTGNAFTPAALADACEGRSGWSDPAPPAHLHGNSWLVGTCGITAVLVTSPQGHVLIDGGPSEAAPLVAANIARLGFRIEDVEMILSSHEHFDHVGALAELQRMTGAPVAAMPAAAAVLGSGKPAGDDPQHADLPNMAPVKIGRILADGEEVRVGQIGLTGYATPVHSGGSTSWTWRSCAGADCRTITFADSNSAISADAYRFTDHPGRIAAAEAGLARMASLPCGILITPHPSSSSMFARFASGDLAQDPLACAAYAMRGRERLAQRLAAEVSK